MLMTLSVIWAVLASMVLGLVVYRKYCCRNEDDYIHVNDVRVVERQSSLNKTLEWIDRWGKLLSGIVVVYGLGLLAMFLYNSWNESQNVVLK